MSRYKIAGSRVAVAAAIGAIVMVDAVAQVAPPQAAQPPTYSPPPQEGYAQPPPAPPRVNPLRQLFAGTLAAVLQGVTGGLTASVSQGVSGSVTNWFDRRQRNSMGAPQYAYGPQTAPAYPGNANPQSYPAPSPTYGTQPPYPTQPTYGTQPTYPTQPATGTQPAYPAQPTYGTQSTYPTQPTTGTQPTYPGDPSATNPNTTNPYPTSAPAYPGTPPVNDPYATTPSPNVYPSQPSYDWSATQVYDPRTGQMTSAQAGGYSLAQTGSATVIVAGGAYDVYALGRDGLETPVNAATHEFRTGDRFKVYFRPSLPGRLDVSNINAYGRETRVDSIDTPAGQLTTLGPYEFAGTKGDEALRFVLSPCASQQLLAATRDIVNVGATAAGGYAAPASGGLNLSGCSALATRSVDRVQTRDIQKVGVDGTTSFALDPVSQAELASGQLTPREFTVYFHHR
jgi:hypothetical protein